MSEPITDEVAATLCEKLRKADLTPEERELLNAILRIVWDVTGPGGRPDRDFDVDLGGCFEEGQAAIIMHYQATESVGSITKSLDGASVSRTFNKSITQGIPPRQP